MSGVSLRPVEDADLDALFDQMRDPESVWMAAFTARDPDDRAAFDAHMASTRPPGTSAVAADPAESPTPGFTYLQFQALLTAARQSPNPCDFALVARPGLLGLRIFEATSADIAAVADASLLPLGATASARLALAWSSHRLLLCKAGAPWPR